MASLISAIAEATETKRKDVKVIYEAITQFVHDGLKKDRKARLPGLGIVSLKFKPARPKRKGKNPFTGEMQMFKAKPASNKLKFRPAKDLRNFADKLPKIAPKKRK